MSRVLAQMLPEEIFIALTAKQHCLRPSLNGCIRGQWYGALSLKELEKGNVRVIWTLSRMRRHSYANEWVDGHAEGDGQ